MIDSSVAELQKYFVKAFQDNDIKYSTNRAENLPFPYLKLWELNSWCEECKTFNEEFVRFTWWFWDYDKNTKNTLTTINKIHEIAKGASDKVSGIVFVDKEKEAIRDAQKPDSKCTVIVYKFKLYGGK